MQTGSGPGTCLCRFRMCRTPCGVWLFCSALASYSQATDGPQRLTPSTGLGLCWSKVRHLEQTQMLPAVKVPLHLFLADGQSRGAAIYQAAHALAMAGAKGVYSKQMSKAAACAGCYCYCAPGLVPAAMPPWQLLQARQAAPGMPDFMVTGTHSRIVQQAIHAGEFGSCQIGS